MSNPLLIMRLKIVENGQLMDVGIYSHDILHCFEIKCGD